MVFVLIAFSGEKMLPTFLKKGLRGETKEYLDQVLKAHVFTWVVANFPDRQEVLFVQDGVQTYQTAKTVLSETMSLRPKQILLPSSPDLNPLNFSVWTNIEARACDH